MARPTDDVTVVTTAGRSATEDRRIRQRRYLLTQLARLVCFVLAVSLPVPLGAKLVLVVGAFALPWMGVVAANAGPVVSRRPRPTALVDRQAPERIALDPGRDVSAD